jgi:carboxylesterase
VPSRCEPTPARAASVRPPAGAVEGFALPGSRPLGCVLVHGFTGTPWEMRPLGEALAARGFPVEAVRLPGHGTRPADLAEVRWTDWSATVAAAARGLAIRTGHVALIGMSMGGLLALHLAAEKPALVSALVLCGTPLTVDDPRAAWLPAVARVPLLWRWLARRYAAIPKPDGPDIVDRDRRAASPSYRTMPLHGILELVQLQRAVVPVLGRVTEPALLLHGRHDRSVPLTNLERLRRALGSRDVEVHVLERSGHVVTVDLDRDEVARLTADFLERIETRGMNA